MGIGTSGFLKKLLNTGDPAPAAQSSPEQAEAHFRQLLATLMHMAWFVEARDPYTGGHLWRVARYAQLLGTEAGLGNVMIARAGLGGFLHDLGKIGVPDAILRKPDKLTEVEYAIIKTHTDIGLRMLSAHPLISLVRDAVHLHHERPDGKGYPLGLAGKDIPLVARIVGICDAFDAMTSYRPYHKAATMEYALNELLTLSGKQFDAELVPLMEYLWEKGALHHIQGHSEDGIRLQECVMCGPTIVLNRKHAAGDLVYCRNCAGEYTVKNGDREQAVITPTGRQGTAMDLEPQADEQLIGNVIAESVHALPVSGLMNLFASSTN